MSENTDEEKIYVQDISLVYWLDSSVFDTESPVTDTAFPAWKITYNRGKNPIYPGLGTVVFFTSSKEEHKSVTIITDNKGEMTMTLSFCSFSSGSSGNCYLIKSEHTAVLVDAGISRKKIYEGLELTGTPREQLAALLITHEHSDHTKSIKTLMKKEKNLKAYANAMTWKQIGCEAGEEQKVIFETGDAFPIGEYHGENLSCIP